ncbi:jg6856, partial [Pararge aegeria aegeria]
KGLEGAGSGGDSSGDDDSDDDDDRLPTDQSHDEGFTSYNAVNNGLRNKVTSV